MKFLVTGGNRGLGKVITDRFDATSISRENGFNITKDLDRIVNLSLDYDIFVNNAFDGPPHESWANFAQSQVYMSVYDAWFKANKVGYIINIGSVGEQRLVPPEPRFETYRISKAALRHASMQGTEAFKQNIVRFKTTLLTIDRLDTPLSRSRPNWTDNGLDLVHICDYIDLLIRSPGNTCAAEIQLWCNFQHKQ